MEFEAASQKQLNELERCVIELLAAMRKAKLQTDPLVEPLRDLQKRLEKSRRDNFDAKNPEFHTY